jgi:hypothetical protein
MCTKCTRLTLDRTSISKHPADGTQQAVNSETETTDVHALSAIGRSIHITTRYAPVGLSKNTVTDIVSRNSGERCL